MEDILFKDEIASSFLKVANHDKLVHWTKFFNDMTDFLVEQYDGKNFNVYRGDWKRRVKLVAKSMGYKLSGGDDYEQAWATLEKDLDTKKIKLKSSKSSKSTESNYRLSEDEKSRVLIQYDNILQQHKWTLSTGTVVDDQMKQLVIDSSYEHPAHSMMIDPSDKVWKNYFSPTELVEIGTYDLKALCQLPSELTQYIDSYDKEWKSAIDLYEYADSQHHHPVTDFDKKWVRESVMRVAELFLYRNALELNDYSEADLLHDVWPFVYRAFKDQKVKAKLGERCSVAVAMGRNEERTLEAVERRARKMVGAKVDALFKSGIDELGACEVGKDKVMIKDDKYMDDGLIKLPKTLRDMLATLVQKNPAKVNQLSTIGFLMMGLCLELVVVDCPVGGSVVRITKTPKLEFPSHVSTIALDLLPLLEATWKAKAGLEATLTILKDRKRKAVELGPGTDHSISLPYSFVRRSSF